MDEAAARQEAIRRYLAGERPGAICKTLGRSRDWFYRWLRRYRAGVAAWWVDGSHARATSPNQTDPALARQIVAVRDRLVASPGTQIGAEAIRWELTRLGLDPPPAVWTVNRVLKRAGRIRAPAPYVPKGVPYPDLTEGGRWSVHQADLVGPRYLTGGGLFYSLHVMDLPTHRVKLCPSPTQDDGALMAGLVASWHALGPPDRIQLDHKFGFCGSPRYPRSFGQVIRLCLQVGTEPVFIPVGEPWRNGALERFNDVYDKRFLRVEHFASFAALVAASARFERHHNAAHHYSVLGGQTPDQAAAAARGPRLPRSFGPPAGRLPLFPGRIHLVRFIRSDLALNVFGERFLAPSTVQYEYVVVTIDTAAERLHVRRVNGEIVLELAYPLPG